MATADADLCAGRDRRLTEDDDVPPTVVRQRFADVYLLPEEAVLRDEEGSYVYLANDEHARRVRIEIISQVAQALIYAHSGEDTGGEPLVHLDLKPEHIFLERTADNSIVRVIDFGPGEGSAIAQAPGSS